MLDRITNIANLVRLKKEQDDKFVLLLGAGASLSSGVPTTTTIMEELLGQYDNENRGGDIKQRFDQLWNRTPGSTRRGFLQPYLSVKKRPSVGYEKLAELIKAGYFDVILTFNFDQLLEQALRDARFTDFARVIRGETIEDQMQKLVNAKAPRCKLVKLHGSLESTDYFLFDSNEMYRYPAAIEALVSNVTGRNIVVCGYAFKDRCVTSAFAARGDSIVCVDPKGVPSDLAMILKDRRSEDYAVEADFDQFFSALHRELLAPAPRVEEKPPPNPFKFLESYDEHDESSFRGRDGEIEVFFTVLNRDAPQVIVIPGPGKAGKTSLVRAGLLSRLDPLTQRGVYLRCRPEIETHLPKDLAALGVTPDGLDLSAALTALAESAPGQRVILFLDQFDRVTSPFKPHTKQGKKDLSDFLHTRLFAGLQSSLTLVLVITDTEGLGGWLAQECTLKQVRNSTVLCPSFERSDVVDIIQSLAGGAGFAFDARIIEDMAERFEQSKNEAPKERFTLAHIHAICHVLAVTRQVHLDSYKAFDENLNALNQAINVVEFMDFAEDCDYPISAWMRNMLKVPLRESREGIAQFIKAHYEELLPSPDRRKIRRNGRGVGAGT